MHKCINFPLLIFGFIFISSFTQENDPIDRHALVTRHNIHWNNLTGQIPIGNGEFCFNADGTGLQTFGGSTISNWAWHSFPLVQGYTKKQIPSTGTFQLGNNKGLDEFPKERIDLKTWMFDNPHKINLARIRLIRGFGNELLEEDVKNISRNFNLWTGILTSTFEIDNQIVIVTTVVDPNKNLLSIKINSELIKKGILKLSIDFPYPSTEKNTQWVGDFNNNLKHSLQVLNSSFEQTNFKRKIDDMNYYSSIRHPRKTEIKFNLKEKPNQIELVSNSNLIEFSIAFSKKKIYSNISKYDQTILSSSAHWPKFWKSGGAIDLSESKDKRWFELERRIILSQYLMASQASGSYPPAEIGLMGMDPWRGQFHMEMIWWHLAHFALWDRWDLAQKGLGVYENFTPQAKKLAKQLGYKGLKWQKSVGPEGRSAPWEGNQILLWKQPHPIYFAELDYRIKPTKSTLKKWAKIIDGTAEHMADYPKLDSINGVFHLDPVMPPSEQGVTKDDIFDLAYWKWGLEKAQVWRERMGLKRNDLWENVKKNLEKLPVKNNLFLHSAEWEDTYSNRNWEHPNIIGIYGMLPPIDEIDPIIAHNSLIKVWETWDWKKCWGWDFPWTAMAAARLNEPNIAIEALLLDAGTKNYYDNRGVCTGGPCPYLPGNGGLLYAVAMMCAGWDGAPNRIAPGFPDDGNWTVKWEGLNKAP